MFCSNCGAQLPDGSRFCSGCGANLGGGSTGQPQDPQKLIIEHSTKKGQDMSSGFGRGFGETMGKQAGGCAWRAIIIVVFVIIVVIGVYTCQ